MKKEEIKISKDDLKTLNIFLEDNGIKMGKAKEIYQTVVYIAPGSIISWDIGRMNVKETKFLLDILNKLITSNHKLILEV